MHEAIAAGVQAARLAKGWTQEDAARAFRHHGLAAWRTSSVGQLEAGLRRPRLDELLLIAAALEVTLGDLVPDSEETVELGEGAWMSPRAVRALLCREADPDPFDNPLAETHFPGDAEMAQRAASWRPEAERLEKLLQPIGRRAQPPLTSSDFQAALHRTPDDADRHAARRLGIEPAQVRLAARALWRRDFAEERDARVGDASGVPQRTLQARRGHAARAMIAELSEFLRDTYPVEE